MNKDYSEYSKYNSNQSPMFIYAAAHPGGGYVAWPEEKTFPQGSKTDTKVLNEYIGRKGFVARPEQTQPVL